MRKILFGLALSVLVLGAATAQAMVVQSELGYSITLPEGWVALEKGTVKENPDIVDAAMKAAGQTQGMSAFPEKVMSAVKELIGQGKIDYYFSPEPSYNISVYEAVGSLTPAEKGTADICASLREEMKKETEGKSKVYDCQVKRMGMRDGLFLAAEDYRSGQKFVQEMVQKDPEHILIFTASSPQKDVNTMRGDFMSIMQTAKIN
jgi:hypothetical protein